MVRTRHTEIAQLWISSVVAAVPVPMGNVQFVNINISITNGMTDHYFNFQDGSNIGITNVQFEPGTLSGATNTPPNGLVQGVGTNVID